MKLKTKRPRNRKEAGSNKEMERRVAADIGSAMGSLSFLWDVRRKPKEAAVLLAEIDRAVQSLKTLVAGEVRTAT